MIKYNHISQYTERVISASEKMLEDILEVGQATAQTFVGVDTGALQDSIKIKRLSNNHYQLSAGEGLGDARALYNNYGTVFQYATGFMNKAADDMQHIASFPNIDL